MSLLISFLSCIYRFHLGTPLPWMNRFLPGRTGNLARPWPLKTVDLGTLAIDTPIHARPRRVYHYFFSYFFLFVLDCNPSDLQQCNIKNVI